MTSMNISIKKDAYEFLKRLKTSKRSFSDVILSFKKDQSDILSFFGVLKESNWDEKEHSMKALRESINKRIS